MPYLRISGVRIHYTISGSGPPVVLLAGLSFDTGMWDPLTGYLEGHGTLVKVDLRGSGRSDAPRGAYAIGEMAEELGGLGRALGIADALIVGHSMGGFVAIETALRGDRLAGGLVLVSTAAVGNARDLGMTARAASALARRNGPFEDIVRESFAVGLGSAFREKSPERVEEAVAKRLMHPPSGAGFMGQTAAGAAFDRRGGLGAVQIPCAIVHGSEDEVIPFPRAVELARDIAGARLVELKGVGHFPPIEDPASLARVIRDLLKRVLEKRG